LKLAPVQKMWERVEVARQDSDLALFLTLLYTGEAITKTFAAGLVAALEDSAERHRYRQLHRLVRADGLGEWTASIDEMLVGPASQHLVQEANIERNEFNQKSGPGTWQHESTSLLDACLRRLDKDREGIPFKLEGKRWFTLFAGLRNRTRGHGAPSSSACQSLCTDLERSLRLLCDNCMLFKRQWAYLHQNLSGKYRVTQLGDIADSFDKLKGLHPPQEWGHLANGVYVYLGLPCRVELIQSDSEAEDFYYPNGGFNGKRFELLSYLSGNRAEGDAQPYLGPAAYSPKSETQGLGTLDVQGKCFGNLPPIPPQYITRKGLEQELQQRLVDDRHPIITLVGRGGIGKTSVALTVLHCVSQLVRFCAIFWFSARDIDLLPEGPKVVQAHLKTETDIAKEFVRLTEPVEARAKGFKPDEYLAGALAKSTLDSPFLFVFDNFETVRNPVEIFTWLDTHVRLPNKVLITTRFREFRGDFDVHVPGMTFEECHLLIVSTAIGLGVERLLTPKYERELFREADGHPYVIKVLLGEIAKANRLVKVEHIVASKDTILEALFERTYSGLSPGAKLVFLTLCGWRSVIPQLAVEVAMLRDANERLDVDQAIEELRRSSFIDVSVPEGEKRRS